ncbi:MAG: hypothetical protein R3282_00060 [Rhodothermales bacterium]|nr:hypothetical protein [Rhodothermales bacterium]
MDRFKTIDLSLKSTSKTSVAVTGEPRRRPRETGSESIITDPVDQIRSLCKEESGSGTAYRSAAKTAAESLDRVIAAELALRDAALSLGQEEELSKLAGELNHMAEALHLCSGPNSRTARPSRAVASSKMDSITPALPHWWFALSEMLQITEREIELLTTIGRGQPQAAAGRKLCNLAVRVLRRHYQLMLREAEEWMSVPNV